MVAKQEAMKLLENMPDSASWDDIMYNLYIRQNVEAGRQDVRDGRVHSKDEARRMMNAQ